MPFNPQKYPFTALPTNLRDKFQPNQIAVLWVIESFASKDDQECYPSLSRIARAAGMSKRTAQKVINQLVSLGWLERKHQKGKNGQQGTNLYRVTVWHLANVPEPSVERRGKSCTPAPDAIPTVAPDATPLWQQMPPPIARDATKLDTYKQDTYELDINNTKTNSRKKLENKFFEPFWEAYRAIPTINPELRVVTLSKKLAKAEFAKLSKKTQEKLLDCLQADISVRKKQKNNNIFTPLFPDAHRWISKGQFEQYLLTVDKKPITLKKLKNTPFLIPNEKP